MAGVTLPLALVELSLIDAYEFVAQPTLAGHGPRLVAGLATYLDVKHVSRRAFGSGRCDMSREGSRRPRGDEDDGPPNGWPEHAAR